MDALTALLANLGVLLLILGIGGALAASWVLLVKAYHENVLWVLVGIFGAMGMAWMLASVYGEAVLWAVVVLLFPMASFLFVVRHWEETKLVALGYLGMLLVMGVGAALILIHPSSRERMAKVFQRGSQRFEAIAEVSRSVDPKGPSSALRKQEELFEKAERERLRQREIRQRAVELYAFVEAWRTELVGRQPDEDATEEVRLRFQLEHENYRRLLDEYKRATEEVRLLDAAAGIAPKQAVAPEVEEIKE